MLKGLGFGFLSGLTVCLLFSGTNSRKKDQNPNGKPHSGHHEFT